MERFARATGVAQTKRSEGEHIQRMAPIRRTDDERREVLAEVYAPWVLDTYGEYMTPEDIRRMAHAFMELDLSTVIDTNHDNIPNGCVPRESFIARAGDPDFTEGSWVLRVYIPDDTIWDQVKRGDLNGFSFEALVQPVMTIVRATVLRDHVGATRSDDVGADHEHKFFVQVNAAGRIIGGATSPGPDGHIHEIRRASYTEAAGEDGHKHRFDLN